MLSSRPYSSTFFPPTPEMPPLRTLEDMAEAADKVLAEAPAVSTVSAIDCAADGSTNLARVLQSPRKPKDPSLCYIHNHYGRGAFKCASPRMCRMKDITVKSAPGNSNAGRQ